MTEYSLHMVTTARSGDEIVERRSTLQSGMALNDALLAASNARSTAGEGVAVVVYIKPQNAAANKEGGE